MKARWVVEMRGRPISALRCRTLALSWLLSVWALAGCVPQAGGAWGQGPGGGKIPAAQRRLPSNEERSPNHGGPLTLDGAIQEALAASPEIEQMRRRLDAALEQLRQAEGAFYPRLVFSEEFDVTDNPVFALMHIINQRRLKLGTDFNHPGRQQNVGSRIEAQWSVFEGGSRWFEREAADHHRRSLEAELLAARNRLVATVTETYFRWLQALDFIRVAERALEAGRTDERLAVARVRAETALPSEVLRLKTRTAEAHSNLVTAQISARGLQAALERLLARALHPQEIPDPRLFMAPASAAAPPRDTSRLVERALQKRPEIAAVGAMIQAARDRVRAARGELLPKLAVHSSYQLDSEDLGKVEDSWMVGIGASWTLFQGGLTLSKVREAQARLREMQARGEQVALDVALEVQQAVLGVEEAAEKIRVAEQRRHWAVKSVEETRRLYEHQVVTVDALLQVEVALNRAEVAHAAALFDGKIAEALLRKTLGEFASWVEARHE